jgi:hypothetical protein
MISRITPLRFNWRDAPVYELSMRFDQLHMMILRQNVSDPPDRWHEENRHHSLRHVSTSIPPCHSTSPKSIEIQADKELITGTCSNHAISAFHPIFESRRTNSETSLASQQSLTKERLWQCQQSTS